MNGVATSLVEGRESVVGGLQWVEKNTFLDVVPTTGVEVSMAPVRRENSAPASVSYSTGSTDPSDNSAGDSDGEEPMEYSQQEEAAEPLEGGVQGGSGAERPKKQSRRPRPPCKGKRDKYKLYAEQWEQRIIDNPSLDVVSLRFPPWVSENPTLERKLRTRLEKLKASINGDDQHVGNDRPGPAPKRALSPGGGLPRAKRQAGPGASQSQSSASSSEQGWQGQPQPQGVPRHPGRQRVLVSL